MLFSMRAFVLILALLCSGMVGAQQKMVITVHQLTDDMSTKGIGTELGTVTLEDTPYGLLLTPKLKGLSTGLHGFHVHEHPCCDIADKEGKPVQGACAGGHFDPKHSNKHQGPYQKDSHLGDLPPLYFDENQIGQLPVLAPRLKIKDIKGRTLMLHQGGDNFSDEPSPLGGGGARAACGVIQ